MTALRNGTIGWLLAGQELEFGAERTYTDVSPEQLRQPQAELEAWRASTTRTLHCCDVRNPVEYEAGHLPGSLAWAAAGGEVHSGSEGLLAQPIDRYRRPHEGIGNPVSAMQAYLDWE